MLDGVDWNGDQVLENVLAATRAAIDETTAASVIHAKSNHPWQNQTGTLEGSYQMRPSEVEGDMVAGEWGSFDVIYAAVIEDNYPALRPAADTEYPQLAERISKRVG